MLTLAILLLLMSNAVTISRDKSMLFASSSLAILAFCFILCFNTIHFDYFEYSVSLATTSHISNMLMFFITLLVLSFSGFLSKNGLMLGYMDAKLVIFGTKSNKFILFLFFCGLFSVPTRLTLMSYLSILDVPALTILTQASLSVYLLITFFSVSSLLCLEEKTIYGAVMYSHFFLCLVLLSMLYVYQIITMECLMLALILELSTNGVGMSHCMGDDPEYSHNMGARPMNFDRYDVTDSGFWTGDRWSPKFPIYREASVEESMTWNSILLPMVSLHLEETSESNAQDASSLLSYQWTESSFKYLSAFSSYETSSHLAINRFMTPAFMRALEAKSNR